MADEIHRMKTEEKKCVKINKIKSIEFKEKYKIQ
jgi:hypothetical protein